MKCGITTTGTRPQYLNPLIKILAPTVDSLRLFVDSERRGFSWNSARMYRTMLDQAKKDEPILFCTDDVITVPDWEARWRAIHAQAGSEIYVLGSLKRSLFKAENMERGFFTGTPLRGFYDIAVIFINQQGLFGRVDKWLKAGGKDLPRVRKRLKHSDVMVQEYLIYNGIPWTTAIPCLFDHIGMVSSLNHSCGRCPEYVGNR